MSEQSECLLSLCMCPTELTVCSRSGVFVLLFARPQVRRLYQQALQKLPLSAALWKDVNSLLTSPHLIRLRLSCCGRLAHMCSSLSVFAVFAL